MDAPRTIRWRMRIKCFEDGTFEAEIRTHQGKSLAKHQAKTFEDASKWLSLQKYHRDKRIELEARS